MIEIDPGPSDGQKIGFQQRFKHSPAIDFTITTIDISCPCARLLTWAAHDVLCEAFDLTSATLCEAFDLVAVPLCEAFDLGTPPLCEAFDLGETI